MEKLNSLALISLFILVAFLLFGCTVQRAPSIPQNNQNEVPKQNTEPKPPVKQEVPSLKPADFFPVQSGASWDYAGEGNEYASFTRKVIFSSGDLAQLREDNGGTVSASVYKRSADSVTRIFFSGEEYIDKNHLNSTPNDNLIILKAPLSVGTKWSEKNGTREIVDTNATVTTPKGTFTQCLKVRITLPNSESYEYFKQGVGLIKREFVSGDTRITSSLKNYRLP